MNVRTSATGKMSMVETRSAGNGVPDQVSTELGERSRPAQPAAAIRARGPNRRARLNAKSRARSRQTTEQIAHRLIDGVVRGGLRCEDSQEAAKARGAGSPASPHDLRGRRIDDDTRDDHAVLPAPVPVALVHSIDGEKTKGPASRGPRAAKSAPSAPTRVAGAATPPFSSSSRGVATYPRFRNKRTAAVRTSRLISTAPGVGGRSSVIGMRIISVGSTSSGVASAPASRSRPAQPPSQRATPKAAAARGIGDHGVSRRGILLRLRSKPAPDARCRSDARAAVAETTTAAPSPANTETASP